MKERTGADFHFLARLQNLPRLVTKILSRGGRGNLNVNSEIHKR